ncbi:MAG: hypothetical protein ACOVOL_07620, partial [Bacteroidia bacterium]
MLSDHIQEPVKKEVVDINGGRIQQVTINPVVSSPAFEAPVTVQPEMTNSENKVVVPLEKPEPLPIQENENTIVFEFSPSVSGNSQLSNLDSIDWGNGQNKWLSVEIWKNNNYQLMGKTPLMFAPFSLYSKQ